MRLCLCSFCFYHLFIWRSAGTWRQLSKPWLFRVMGRLEALVALKNKLYLEKSVMKQGIMGRQLCLFLITSVTCQPYNEVLFWAFDSWGTWTSATLEPGDVFIVVFLWKRDIHIKNIARLYDVHINSRHSFSFPGTIFLTLVQRPNATPLML